MIIQACLNGARKPGSHPALPLTPAALAADAAACVAAGAQEIHLHVRGADGRESLAPDDVDATLSAVRARLPGTLLGISTGAWIERDTDRTLARIAAWRMLPDYASVNLSEPGAPAVIAWLRARGVAIEAGIWTLEDAARLAALGLGDAVLRVLVEIRAAPDDPAPAESAPAAADSVLEALHAAGLRRPVLLHGFDVNAWSLVGAAAARRLSTRIGLEDVLALPDGRQAPDNAALVAAARIGRAG